MYSGQIYPSWQSRHVPLSALVSALPRHIHLVLNVRVRAGARPKAKPIPSQTSFDSYHWPSDAIKAIRPILFSKRPLTTERIKSAMTNLAEVVRQYQPEIWTVQMRAEYSHLGIHERELKAQKIMYHQACREVSLIAAADGAKILRDLDLLRFLVEKSKSDPSLIKRKSSLSLNSVHMMTF